MVLQQWYDASDEAIEEALWDRVSFKRFVGLGIEGDVPDHSTISRFRKEVSERGLGLRLFKELARQLRSAGTVREAGHAAGCIRSWRRRRTGHRRQDNEERGVQ